MHGFGLVMKAPHLAETSKLFKLAIDAERKKLAKNSLSHNPTHSNTTTTTTTIATTTTILVGSRNTGHV